MHLLHLYHSRRFHKFFHTDMWRFDLSIWLHLIARSSISIFIPIFLLEIGYSIIAVISYYLLVRIVDVPLNFLSAKLIQKIGARKVYLIGTAAVIAFFSLFSRLTVNQWPLLGVLIVLVAIYDTAFWVSHLYLFEKVSHKLDKISQNTGLLYAVKYFAGMLGPAIGALILIFANSKSLMFFSILIFILSAIPLFKLRLAHEKPAEEEPLLSPRKFFSQKEERRNYLSIALYALHRTTETVVWPIFIYFTFQAIQAVAIVPVIISGTAILFSYVAGKFARHNRERIIAIAAILISLVWVSRMLISASSFYYISIFMVSFLALFLSVALYSNIFSRGKKVGILSAVTYNNATSMAAQILVYAALLFALAVLKVSFVIAALGLFALTLVNLAFSLAKSSGE